MNSLITFHRLPSVIFSAVMLGLMITFWLTFPVYSQSGSVDPDEDAVYHLQLARIYEQSEEWEKALKEYEAATTAKSVQYRQMAADGLQRVLTLKSDPFIRLRRETSEYSFWFAAALIKISIVAVLGLLLLALILRISEKSAALTIIPFTDLTGQTKDIGASIAETIVNTLHQARSIHTVNQAGRILSLSEAIDLPSFSSQLYAQNLATTLTSLNALNVGGIGLPIGSILESILAWLNAGHRRITGSLQRYGNTYQLTARLEEGRAHRCIQIWQVCENYAPEEAAQKLASLASSLAYHILLGLNSEWGTKSAKSLEQFTLGLDEICKYRIDSSNLLALENAIKRFEDALVADPIYTIAKYNLALGLISAGSYEKGIPLLKSLQLHPHTGLDPEISYNLGTAYYHLVRDWAYDSAEEEFNKTIEMLGSLLPSQSGKQHSAADS